MPLYSHAPTSSYTLYVSLYTFLYKRDTSRDTSKDIGRDASRGTGKDTGRDTGRDAGRDTGRVEREIGGGRGGEAVENGWLKRECQNLNTVHLGHPFLLLLSLPHVLLLS